MKLCIIFSCILALASAKALDKSSSTWRRVQNSDGTRGIIQMITEHGYPAEDISVTTEDGYILNVIRISRGVTNEKARESKRPAILLMHGFMSSAEDFVYGGPTHGLAFILADRGYDVYLGNTRGSRYGMRHTKLNPHKDAAFWRFCWHEIGIRDLPAIINKILERSNQDKISYVGHMEGATAFLVMASERPENLVKIEKVITLSPIGFIGNSRNTMLNTIVQNYKSKTWVMKNVGQNMFTPSNELTNAAKIECIEHQDNLKICDNVYFLFNNYNSGNLNDTTVECMLNRVPTGGSVREVLHFAQLIDSGRFKKYDANLQRSDLGRDYDLSKVRVPVAVFYTPHDSIVNTVDIKDLTDKLPDVFRNEMVDCMTNNLDMLFGKHVLILYEKIVKALNENVKM